MQNPAEIRDVSDTATWVAHYRAEESQRPDALFRDPLAAVLVGERGAQIARSFGRTSRYTAWTVVARTVIIDEYILDGIRNGTDAVVNLGAGLDTRPYRLELPPAIPWVEADFPHIIEYKEKMLRDQTPRCRLHRVGVDLSNAAARRQFLTDVVSDATRVLILTEGVIPYMTEAQVAELADDLRAQPRFASWIAEYFSPGVYRYLRRVSRSRVLANAPFRFFPDDWLGHFRTHGWERKKMRFFGEIAQRFGRRPPFPWWAGLMLSLMSKDRRAEARRMSGYMVLAPLTPVTTR